MNSIELNKIYCESNMDTMSRMPNDFIDLTVTSPPYDNLRTYKNDIHKSWGDEVWKPIIKELYRVTKKGGVVVWVVNDATINGSETGTSFKQALWAIECGFNLHDTMIYERVSPYPEKNRYRPSFEYMFVFSKESPKTYNILTEPRLNISSVKSSERQPNGDIKIVSENAKRRIMEANKRDYTQRKNIWRCNAGFTLSSSDKISFHHPAIFPEKLAADHIVSWSNEGDIVYDPFMGSGTTAKMAHTYKRHWIGSEISQDYVDLAYKRLEPYLAQQTLF